MFHFSPDFSVPKIYSLAWKQIVFIDRKVFILVNAKEVSYGKWFQCIMYLDNVRFFLYREAWS